MTRIFSYVFALVFFACSIVVWVTPSGDKLRAEENIESTEQRAETVSSFSIAFFSKARRVAVPGVTNLISASGLGSIQFCTQQTHLDLLLHHSKNTNTPIHIAKQVFLI